MERHIRWRMFLVMFIVSASPSFCPSTTMLQCLHLNFPFHVLSDFWTVMVTPMLCFVVSNCSKHAAQLHILPYIQYRIECYTPVWASWKKEFPRDSPKNDANGMELHLFSGDDRAVSSLFTSIIWQKASRRVTTVKTTLRSAVIFRIYQMGLKTEESSCSWENYGNKLLTRSVHLFDCPKLLSNSSS